MKFKIGDKVRHIQNNYYSNYSDYGFGCGEIGTIDNSDSPACISVTTRTNKIIFIEEQYLELLNEDEMLVYFHQNSSIEFGRGTFAFKLPNKATLLEMVNHGAETLVLPFGLAMTHPSDRFVKAMGRSVALSKMKNTLFILEDVKFLGTRSVFNFNTSVFSHGQTINIEVGLSICAKSNNVHIDYAFFSDVVNNY